MYTDLGIESGISVRELISSFKKKCRQASEEKVSSVLTVSTKRNARTVSEKSYAKNVKHKHRIDFRRPLAVMIMYTTHFI